MSANHPVYYYIILKFCGNAYLYMVHRDSSVDIILYHVTAHTDVTVLPVATLILLISILSNWSS